jgi:mycobactin phenyloxazoline synthetase
MIDPELTIDALQARVASLVAGFGDDEPAVIDAQANLFELGLESIALMQLVAGWRKAGLDVNFAELAERPTLNDWLQMLGERAANVHPAEINGDTGTGQEDGEFPLGLMQHAYWIGRGQGQRLSGVAAHLYAEFDGAGVEAPRLRRALDKLVARHDMLRARITDNGQQVIEPSPGRAGLAVHDLRELADGDVTARLSQLRDTMSHQVLDIEHGEVFAAALSLLPGGATRFHLDVDMVAADAVSYRILLSDLAVFYASPVAELPPVGYRYRRYLAARAELRGDARASAAQYWQRRLPSLPRAPALPMAVTHGEARPRAARRHCHLSAVQKAALEAAVRRRGVTPSMAIATLFAEVIGRWSADPRFLLNVPLFDRAPVHPNVGDVVGDFSSSLLLEVDLTEQVSFAERARAVQAQTHAHAAHGDFSGVEVLRELTRRDTEQALATVVFTSALSLGELYSPMSREQFGDPVWMISQGPQVLLDAQITELSGGLLVNWDIRLDALADGVPEAMFAAFERLVRDLADDKLRWEEPIGDLVPAEQYAVRARRNGTVRPPSGRALHEGVFQLARRSPEAIALAGTGSGTLSYGELAQRALRVAGALAHRGIGRGHQVGISARGAEEQVVALLGVLAAGAVYVPVSTDGAEPLPYPDLDLASSWAHPARREWSCWRSVTRSRLIRFRHRRPPSRTISPR